MVYRIRLENKTDSNATQIYINKKTNITFVTKFK